MNIEDLRYKTVELKTLFSGDLFEYNGHVYILSDKTEFRLSSDCAGKQCLKVSGGELRVIDVYTNVRPLEGKLVIEGERK